MAFPYSFPFNLEAGTTTAAGTTTPAPTTTTTTAVPSTTPAPSTTTTAAGTTTTTEAPILETRIRLNHTPGGPLRYRLSSGGILEIAFGGNGPMRVNTSLGVKVLV